MHLKCCKIEQCIYVQKWHKISYYYIYIYTYILHINISLGRAWIFKPEVLGHSPLEISDFNKTKLG